MLWGMASQENQGYLRLASWGGETHSIKIETWDHELCYWEVSSLHTWNYCPLMVYSPVLC